MDPVSKYWLLRAPIVELVQTAFLRHRDSVGELTVCSSLFIAAAIQHMYAIVYQVSINQDIRTIRQHYVYATCVFILHVLFELQIVPELAQLAHLAPTALNVFAMVTSSRAG